VKEVPFIPSNKVTRGYYRGVYDYLSRQTNPERDYLFGIASSVSWLTVEGLVGLTTYAEGKKSCDLLKNRLHSKLKDKLLNYASTGTSLAEGREALNMMSTRLRQIGKAAMLVRRGKFALAASTLDITLPKHKIRDMRNKSLNWDPYRKLSSFWLEYWLGWAPLVGDVYSAMEVLSQDFKTEVQLVRTGRPFELEKWDGTADTGSLHSLSGRLTGQAWAGIQVTNPNLLLLNQLGMINPASVAWAVVPFSFVLGWFVNVQEFLDQFTDFVGLKLIDPGYTLRFKSREGRQEHWRYMVVSQTNPAYHAQWSRGELKCFAMKRYVGVPGVTLTVPPFKGLSKTRAATAISLVVSIFLPKGPRP
jgi:hypothetical protein